MVRWSGLESKIDLGELPAFHRAFLKLNRPELEADTLPLRRVQQYVSQTLHSLVQKGQAKQLDEDFEVETEAIPESYRNLL